MPVLHKECLMSRLQPLLVSIQPCSLKLKLRLRPKPKLKLKPKPKLVLELLPPLKLVLALMLPLTRLLSTLQNKSLMEVSPSTSSSRVPELNANRDKLPRSNIPVPSPLTVRSSTLLFQEDNQSLS